MKIIYTRGNRTETLASLATLRKILNRFVAHRVFYEVSSRSKRGHEFLFHEERLRRRIDRSHELRTFAILIFDAHNHAHSVEILNPETMRIYDEMPGRGFAVSFVSDEPNGVETRCYIRDEGEDGEARARARPRSNSITLPQLFEYLDEITSVEPAVKNASR